MSTATSPALGELLGTVVIDERFNGPADSANGGFAAGALARFVGEPAEVTLRLPPPLGARLDVAGEPAGGAVRLLAGDALVAEGRRAEPLGVEPPVRPSFDEAAEASARHVWRGRRHAFSDCFVCGPERAERGDGLGVSPGALAAHPQLTAAPFVPDASVARDGIVRPEVIWAALDCPSFPPALWSRGPVAVLGRMSAQREREVGAGEKLVAVGWLLGADGRKHATASALLDGDGRLVARARATWIELRT
jgi:hypothetical protein